MQKLEKPTTQNVAGDFDPEMEPDVPEMFQNVPLLFRLRSDIMTGLVLSTPIRMKTSKKCPKLRQREKKKEKQETYKLLRSGGNQRNSRTHYEPRTFKKKKKFQRKATD